jgi:tetratricopeptide (TPR) repeat protein
VRGSADFRATEPEVSPAAKITVTASALLVACLTASIFFLQRVDTLRSTSTLDDVLYVSSPSMLKRLSLGYDGLAADIYWTRAVQYFGGRHHANARSYRSLYPLLQITTTLDPKLLVAYQFGSSFLAPPPPHGAGMPDKAVQLVNYGIEKNPDSWKLYYEKGFIYYMEMKDYAKAAQAFDEGSRVPGAHPFMKILAANMAQHAGDAQMARALWQTTYGTSQDKQIRANAIAHLRALQVDEDVTRIQQAVTAYGNKIGSLPPNMAALVDTGLLPAILMDPDGHPYKLTSEGRAELANPDDFPFAQKGLPPGYKPEQAKNLQKLAN